MNNFFKIYFFLFAVVFGAIYGMQENETAWYKRLIRDRKFRMLASAAIGGLSAMGMKYSINNNTLFPSLRLPEKIKDATDAKYFLVGSIAGIGLYETIRQLMDVEKESDDKENSSQKTEKDITDQKKTNHRQERTQVVSLPQSEIKTIKKEEDYGREIQVTYICCEDFFPLVHNLLNPWLLGKNNLNAGLGSKIDSILSDSKIAKYNEVVLYLASSHPKYSSNLQLVYLKYASYAAALYLVEEQQKEKFESICKQLLSESELLLYKLYDEIKPTSKKNLWCYVFPLKSLLDSDGFKTYSLNISSDVTKDNIDKYSFKLDSVLRGPPSMGKL